MINIKLLKKLYQINSHSREEQQIMAFLYDYIITNFPSVNIWEDKVGNLYIVKGKAKEYPGVCAHTDQIGCYKGQIYIYRYKNAIIGVNEKGQTVNLGADDKNGVWIALELLRTEPFLKVALFVGEEIGCVGSNACDMSFFDNCKYVIQCDRKGKGDFITQAGSVELCSKDWIPAALKSKYGYKNSQGLMTDVQTLKRRGLKVAACNLSCGYYNPHTDSEYTEISELINCLEFVREIIKTTPLTEHKPSSNDLRRNYSHVASSDAAHYGGKYWEDYFNFY